MITMKLPAALRQFTGGQPEITVAGSTVAEALDRLFEAYPPLRQHLTNDSGQLRPYVNLFLGAENITALQGLETPLKAGDRLILLPSIAGG